MNTWRLECFLALAHELHFGRAAQTLSIAQPSLSAQIRALEADIGTPLFVRSSRMVELTAAGQAFVEGARTVLAETSRAVTAARDVAAGRTGRLVIGSVGAGINGVLPVVLRRLAIELPDIQLAIRPMPSSPAQVRAVAERAIDVGLIRGSRLMAGVSGELLFTESFVVVLPEHHTLARETDPIPLSALSNERFVSWPRDLSPEFHDTITRACGAAGFFPSGHASAPTTEAQFALVAAGQGVSIQAASNAALSRDGVRARQIEPADLSMEMHLIYPATRVSPVSNAFIRLLRQAAASGALGRVRQPHRGS